MKIEGMFASGAKLRADLKVAELLKMTAYQKKRLADADLSVADHSLAEGAFKALADEVRSILAKEGFADPDFIIELVQAEVEDALAADKALRSKIGELRKNKLAYYSSAVTRFQPPNPEPTTRFPNPSMDAD